MSQEEAIVLFELLSRFSEKDSLEINDPSEKVVLWGLLCDLEKILVEPLKADYAKILELARQNLRPDQ